MTGTVDELKARLSELLAADKANPNPGYTSWDAWPAGWLKHRSWKVGMARRRREKRQIRIQLKKLQAAK